MTVTVQSQDQARIGQLLAERETAMRARDAERLVSRYAREIVKFELVPPLRYTGPEVHDVNGLRSWFSGIDGPIDYDCRRGCRPLPQPESPLSTTPHGASERFDLWFRTTVSPRKIDGTWRNTQEHNSTPCYMDGSFKAAVDLQP